MFRKILLFISPLLLFAAVTGCKENNHTRFSVYPAPDSLQVEQGGNTFMALRVEMPAGQHIYGNPKGPGTGKATEVRVDKKTGFTFGVPRFLDAKKYTAQGEKDFVWIYDNETTIFIPVTVDGTVSPGRHEITVTFDALLCSSSTCIPKVAVFTYPLNVVGPGQGTTVHSETLGSLFNKSHLPEETGKGSETAPSPGTKEKLLLADTDFRPEYIESSSVTGLIQAIIFGLIAGFILNFMPCVLPVVSLKVMSFVKHAGESRRELVKLGVLFSLGILTSFLALALLASFFGYGWGGLFQHRIFLIIMTAVVFILALSMFEVFTISAPSFAGRAATERDNRYSDAYVKGLLATLLATPCSGPFLGGTLAWALTQSPLVIFIIFMSVGTGMALPYLILTIRPPLIKLIPKPGEWMRTFEQLMGFLLIFTVVYLVSILDSGLHLPVIAFLAFLGAAFWQYGKFGAIYQSRRKRVISSLALVLIVTAGYFFAFDFLGEKKSDTAISSSAFSEARILANRDAGKISMVKFTADWCPNCKFVEKVALYTPAVAASIRENNIDFMTADITEKNEAAESLMRKLGSRSIPFLAVIPAGADFAGPLCLRDIYSEKDVLTAIDRVRGKDGNSKKDLFKLP